MKSAKNIVLMLSSISTPACPSRIAANSVPGIPPSRNRPTRILPSAYPTARQRNNATIGEATKRSCSISIGTFPMLVKNGRLVAQTFKLSDCGVYVRNRPASAQRALNHPECAIRPGSSNGKHLFKLFAVTAAQRHAGAAFEADPEAAAAGIAYFGNPIQIDHKTAMAARKARACELALEVRHRVPHQELVAVGVYDDVITGGLEIFDLVEWNYALPVAGLDHQPAGLRRHGSRRPGCSRVVTVYRDDRHHADIDLDVFLVFENQVFQNPAAKYELAAEKKVADVAEQ